MHVLPYLNFEGRCEEALTFYREAIGAQVNDFMRYKDHPQDAEPMCEGPLPPGEKVMHASFTLGDSVIMATDGMCKGDARFEGIALTLAVTSEEEARRCFDALWREGNVLAPLTPTFFALQFGMVTDRFGVTWMVINPRERE